MRQQFSFVGEEFHITGHGHSIWPVKVNLYVTYNRSNSHVANYCAEYYFIAFVCYIMLMPAFLCRHWEERNVKCLIIEILLITE